MFSSEAEKRHRSGLRFPLQQFVEKIMLIINRQRLGLVKFRDDSDYETPLGSQNKSSRIKILAIL